MSYSAAIFDLDGTLSDSLRDLAEATNWGLRELGMPVHPVADYRLMVGDGRTMLCRRALPEGREDLMQRLCALMTGYYREHCFDHTRPYPGIERMLATLRGVGMKLAVLSNKPQRFVDLTIETLFSAITFDAAVGDDGVLPLKPDPTGALQVAGALGVRAEQAAYVGDTSIDMKTANAAGMTAIGVTWGFRDRQELEESGAQVIVDGVDRLQSVLHDGQVEI